MVSLRCHMTTYWWRHQYLSGFKTFTDDVITLTCIVDPFAIVSFCDVITDLWNIFINWTSNVKRVKKIFLFFTLWGSVKKEVDERSKTDDDVTCRKMILSFWWIGDYKRLLDSIWISFVKRYSSSLRIWKTLC